MEEVNDRMNEEGEERPCFESYAQEFTMQDEMELEQLQASGILDERAAAACVVPSREELEKQEIDLSNEPASPVRDEWPKDSLLTKDHFTIDTQKCLTCRKDLGHAMPMNRIPKEKYLFCADDVCSTVAVLQCFACDKHFVRDSGHFVHRPGNCAYTFPTQIYNFMCRYCYEEQMATEPGFEETKQKMKEYREYRAALEEKEKDIANLAAGPSNVQPDMYKQNAPHRHRHPSSSSYSSYLPEPAFKRKRVQEAGEQEQ